MSITYTNKAQNVRELGYVNKSDEYIREIKGNGTVIEHKAGKELIWGIYELRNAYLVLKSPGGEVQDSLRVISKNFEKLVFEQTNVPVENVPGTSPDGPDWVTAIIRYEFNRIKN